MSPEQIRSNKVDLRSDLYSLGLTFYEMVTGCRSVQGDTAHEQMTTQLTDTPPEPTLINQAVPSMVSAVIMRAMPSHSTRAFCS
jgi:serine/threonine protein kinase